MSKSSQSRFRERARAAFNRFLKDASGMIRAHDLRAVLQELGLDPSEEQCAQARQACLDPHRREPARISFDEFLELARLLARPRER